MANHKGDETLTGVEKLTRYKLAERIFDTPATIELTNEDKKLINELVGKLFSVVVVGQVFKFLE